MSTSQIFRNTAVYVKAKLFQDGDEDGFDIFNVETGEVRPFISTLVNQKFFGIFNVYYLCYGAAGDRWLVQKDIFESTYEPVEDTTAIGKYRIKSEDVIIDQARQICSLRREVRELTDEIEELIEENAELIQMIREEQKVSINEKTSLSTSNIF